MLLLALNWGGVTYDWGSATIIGLFCGSVGTSVVFVAWEFREGKNAMIPLDMLKNQVIMFASFVSILSQGSLFLVVYYLPIWFQVVKDASPTMGGVYFLPSVGSQVVGSILTGALSTYIPLTTAIINKAV